MMNRLPIAAAFVVLCLVGQGAWAVSPPTMDELLAQLDDERYATREAAMRRLQAAGPQAVEVLVRGALSDSPEVAWRASEALKQIAIQGDERVIDKVAAALDRLGKRGKPGVPSFLAEIRARQKQMKHDRAAAQVRALGGQLSGGSGQTELIGAFGMFGGMAVGIPLIVEEEEAPLAFIEVAAEPVPAAEPAPAAEELETPAIARLLDEVETLLPPTDLSLPADVRLEEAAAPAELSPVADVPPTAPVGEVPAVLPALDAIADEPEEEKIEAPKPDAAAALEPELDVLVGLADVGIADVFVAPAAEAAATGPAPSESLVLDSNWRGGDAGLRALSDLPDITAVNIQDAKLTDAALVQLARLPRLDYLHVSKTPFTSAGLREFRKLRPETRLFAQGQAMIGIHADLSGPCTLTSVYPGSGAAEAGLAAGDQIVSVDGVTIADFSDLTIAVYPHGAGDKLAVEFERDGKRKKALIVLKSRASLEGRD